MNVLLCIQKRKAQDLFVNYLIEFFEKSPFIVITFDAVITIFISYVYDSPERV